MTFLLKTLQTPADPVALILRLSLGLVIFPHGAQKLIGWFGGPGLGGTIDGMQSQYGLAPSLTLLVIVAEFFGPLALAAGFLTRFSAAAIGLVMLGAMFMVHLPFGFFMNWSGAQAGEGFEYHLLALGLAIALVMRGGGAWSMDHHLTRGRPES
ncbi:MAG: DoxX family protein [Gemmatimonadaceae bacterium]